MSYLVVFKKDKKYNFCIENFLCFFRLKFYKNGVNLPLIIIFFFLLLFVSL